MITKDELQHWLAVCEAATEGPWSNCYDGVPVDHNGQLRVTLKVWQRLVALDLSGPRDVRMCRDPSALMPMSGQDHSEEFIASRRGSN